MRLSAARKSNETINIISAAQFSFLLKMMCDIDFS